MIYQHDACNLTHSVSFSTTILFSSISSSSLEGAGSIRGRILLHSVCSGSRLYLRVCSIRVNTVFLFKAQKLGLAGSGGI